MEDNDRFQPLPFNSKEWLKRQELILAQELYECAIPGCPERPVGGPITYELPDRLCSAHWLAWRKLSGTERGRKFGPEARKRKEFQRAAKKGLDGEKRS